MHCPNKPKHVSRAAPSAILMPTDACAARQHTTDPVYPDGGQTAANTPKLRSPCAGALLARARQDVVQGLDVKSGMVLSSLVAQL